MHDIIQITNVNGQNYYNLRKPKGRKIKKSLLKWQQP